jgi:hypothetical protein
MATPGPSAGSWGSAPSSSTGGAPDWAFGCGPRGGSGAFGSREPVGEGAIRNIRDEPGDRVDFLNLSLFNIAGRRRPGRPRALAAGPRREVPRGGAGGGARRDGRPDRPAAGLGPGPPGPDPARRARIRAEALDPQALVAPEDRDPLDVVLWRRGRFVDPARTNFCTSKLSSPFFLRSFFLSHLYASAQLARRIHGRSSYLCRGEDPSRSTSPIGTRDGSHTNPLTVVRPITIL